MEERTTFVDRTGESSGSSALSLPPDLVEKSRGRVRLVATLTLIGFGLDVVLFLGALVGDVFTGSPPGEFHTDFRVFGGDVTAFGASLALILVTRMPRVRHETVLRLGLGFEILICAIISIHNPWATFEETGHVPALTWVSPIIIMFPLIIPVRPVTTAVTALGAASTAPLGLAFLQLTGRVTATADEFVAAAFSPLVAAGFAIVASRVVYQLGIDVARARRVGSYELEEKLGSGGMGEVWRARHRLLARPAAVKLIRTGPSGIADRPETWRRFEREAQATAMMRSPHTIELYDFGVSTEGAFYYVMELLDGLDAEELVRRFGPVEPERAVHLLRQVCDSLAEAHAHGLIHRDIKPANIHVCRYGRRFDFVKVLDFGLVKSRDGSGETPIHLTADNVAAGTPATMSPEQVLGRDVDGRADIYALGCVAHWLLTGHLVFDGSTPMEIMTQHVHGSPRAPSERTEAPVPETLDTLVLACLEKDPEARPRNADAVDETLSRIVFESPWTPERARRWWESRGLAGVSPVTSP